MREELHLLLSEKSPSQHLIMAAFWLGCGSRGGGWTCLSHLLRAKIRWVWGFLLFFSSGVISVSIPIPNSIPSLGSELTSHQPPQFHIHSRLYVPASPSFNAAKPWALLPFSPASFCTMSQNSTFQFQRGILGLNLTSSEKFRIGPIRMQAALTHFSFPALFSHTLVCLGLGVFCLAFGGLFVWLVVVCCCFVLSSALGTGMEEHLRPDSFPPFFYSM